jgi:RNA polymerase sigma factor (sigma-70 family)
MSDLLNEQRIVENHHRLVTHIAKKFKPRNSNELEDYIQIGYIGLIKAIRKYDASKAKFSTIAWNYIKWEIMRHLSKDKIEIIYNDELIGGDTPEQLTLDELIPFHLSTEEKRILQLKLAGFSMKDIASQLDISSYSLKTKYQNILSVLNEEKAHLNGNRS